ncbi:MAG: hypothetical protein ACXVB9_02705 [Bdellovibrionota bacterium]
MKFSLQIVLALLLFSLAGAAYAYFTLIRPAQLIAKLAQPAALERAQEFLACLTSGEVPGCSDSLTTEQFRQIYPPELLDVATKKLRERYGPVKSAQIKKATFAAVEQNKPDVKSLEVNFRLLATFAHDSDVPFDFELVQKGSGPLLVNHFASPL